MDALALLCHLSADGTTTLVRLRQAGYTTLQDVLLGDAEELIELLDVPPRALDRLLRRAEELEDRMGEAAHDCERRPALSAPAPKERPTARRRNALPCRLEIAPLEDDEAGSSPAPGVSTLTAPRPEPTPEPPREAAATEPTRLPPGIPLPRALDGAPPMPPPRRPSHGASRFWMPVRRERPAEEDPGSPGPFA